MAKSKFWLVDVSFGYNFTQNLRNIEFSQAKRLSYILEHILAKFKENPRNGFSAKSQKLPKMAFSPQMSGIRENGQTSQKSARATFYTLFTPNYMASFEKILGAVSEIIRHRHTATQTNKQTHRSDFIGSSRFSTGNQQVCPAVQVDL